MTVAQLIEALSIVPKDRVVVIGSNRRIVVDAKPVSGNEVKLIRERP